MSEPTIEQGCDLCGDQGPLLLRARCHLTAPLLATIEGDQLTLKCYLPECGRVVATFTIVRTVVAASDRRRGS
jgi:hypothetical protein